jgi:hypothetical protein
MVKNILIFVSYVFISLSCKSRSGDVPLVDVPDAPVKATDTVISSTVNFKGVNWADPRDNFVDDWIMLSGINVADDNTAILSKTETILSAFQAAGVNTVRLPINPPTVMQDYWQRYSSIISKASSKGMKVILAYWEAASSKDGKIDDSTAFRLMWNRVTTKYLYNENIYFEIMNEPHGYSLNDLKTLYAGWIANYPDIPRRRIVLDGAGYATEVNGIGDDNRFDGCLLSFHFYTWFSETYKTGADWELPVKSLNYPQRTITTEFGVPMTTGKNYNSTSDTNVEVAYLQGMTNALHNSGVGSIYWPGLRTNDTYSMFSYDGNSVTINNSSGLSLLQYAWRK